MEPMETSMENTSRATATGSKPLGTPLFRVSRMARTPTISSAVPITCGASTTAQRRIGTAGGVRGEPAPAPTWSKKPLERER